MKIIVLILLFVNPAFSKGTKILSCPKEVTCSGRNLKTCQLSDNIDNTWRISGSGTTSRGLLPGRYKFTRALHSMASNPESCHYNHENNYNTSVTVSSQFSIFTPKLVDSMWKESSSGAQFGLECSYNPTLCLWEEEPGIIIQYHVRDPNLVFFYVDNQTGNYKYSKKLLYKELYNICGANSDCLIALGIPYFDLGSIPSRFDYYGIVNVDISLPNEVSIKKIDLSSEISGCQLLRHSLFNILYCKQ
jgi:hypothetical protein